jgi:hypothetical protein
VEGNCITNMERMATCVTDGGVEIMKGLLRREKRVVTMEKVHLLKKLEGISTSKLTASPIAVFWIWGEKSPVGN